MRAAVFPKFLVCLLGFLALVGCVEPVGQGSAGGSRILTMGDSLLAWNSASQNSISHFVERELKEDVLDRSVTGAHVVYDLPISGALGLRISS